MTFRSVRVVFKRPLWILGIKIKQVCQAEGDTGRKEYLKKKAGWEKRKDEQDVGGIQTSRWIGVGIKDDERKVQERRST